MLPRHPGCFSQERRRLLGRCGGAPIRPVLAQLRRLDPAIDNAQQHSKLLFAPWGRASPSAGPRLNSALRLRRNSCPALGPIEGSNLGCVAAFLCLLLWRAGARSDGVVWRSPEHFDSCQSLGRRLAIICSGLSSLLGTWQMIPWQGTGRSSMPCGGNAGAKASEAHHAARRDLVYCDLVY